jgi:hypothetical protein
MRTTGGAFVAFGIRVASILFFLNFQVLASSPPTGHFHVPDATQVVGGPTYLEFEVVNNGAQPLFIRIANPLSPCAGYVFRIESEDRADGTCDGRSGYSCLSSTIKLAPGGKTSQRVLLNYYYVLPHPGRYRVHAERSVTWWTTDEDWGREQQQQKVFEEDVELELKPAGPSELRAAFEPYMKALASTDEQTHSDALQALILLAPQFLEGMFIKMLDSDEWGSALVGLRHLNSPRAREALAKIAEFGVQAKPDADDFEKAERPTEQGIALKYLGEMGDLAYFPLLLKTTQDAPLESQTRIYGTLAVAQLGGQDALPFLVSESRASTKGQRIQGAVAIGFTVSRDAVPVLIDLLQSPEEDVRQVAENGLEMLTHRAATATGDISGTDPVSLYSTWHNWWESSNAGAQIYGARDCGEKLLIN